MPTLPFQSPQIRNPLTRYTKFSNFLGMPIRKLQIRKIYKIIQNTEQLCLKTVLKVDFIKQIGQKSSHVTVPILVL